MEYAGVLRRRILQQKHFLLEHIAQVEQRFQLIRLIRHKEAQQTGSVLEAVEAQLPHALQQEHL